MHRQIYVNLPCKDLAASKAFFEAMGYQFHPQFTNDVAAGLVLGDNLYAMLLTEDSPAASRPSRWWTRRRPPRCWFA